MLLLWLQQNLVINITCTHNSHSHFSSTHSTINTLHTHMCSKLHTRALITRSLSLTFVCKLVAKRHCKLLHLHVPVKKFIPAFIQPFSKPYLPANNHMLLHTATYHQTALGHNQTGPHNHPKVSRTVHTTTIVISNSAFNFEHKFH